LEGHSSRVTSVAFSFDNTHIVLRSSDNTVRMCDVSSGMLQVTLEGHLADAKSVALSSDNTRIASGLRIKQFGCGIHFP
ncbi:hypothetical protein M422DRAFT_166918, partial [Sphaerobolus stellatus SS14]